MQYFTKFPTITYNGQIARNIMARVNFNDVSKKNILVYYPYTMKDYERIDNLSYDYYNDPDFSWLIYHTNQTLDPYYGFLLSPEDFNEFIIKKYGSIENAQSNIHSWKTNWENDFRVLDQVGYDSLPGEVKKYWNPISDNTNRTFSYARKRVDDYITTNRVCTVPFSYNNGSNTFVVGETINQIAYYNSTNIISSASSGISAVIKTIDSTNSVLTVQDVFGNFAYSEIQGSISGATATIQPVVDDTIANGGNNIQRNITANEDIYWAPQSFYDYEFSKNENKRKMFLIDKTRRNDISNQLTLLLSK